MLRQPHDLGYVLTALPYLRAAAAICSRLLCSMERTSLIAWAYSSSLSQRYPTASPASPELGTTMSIMGPPELWTIGTIPAGTRASSRALTFQPHLEKLKNMCLQAEACLQPYTQRWISQSARQPCCEGHPQHLPAAPAPLLHSHLRKSPHCLPGRASVTFSPAHAR